VFAYDPSEWSDLFVAVAGASAALAGLVFVAVSINIERILQFEGLPERALETVLLLVLVLVAAVSGLIPGQSEVALGIEILVATLVFGCLIWRLPTVQAGSENLRWARFSVRSAGTAPFVVGGIGLLTQSGGGLYWVAAGIVFAIVGAIANAWVLLVEILR
jgi:hypothetical protein